MTSDQPSTSSHTSWTLSNFHNSSRSSPVLPDNGQINISNEFGDVLSTSSYTSPASSLVIIDNYWPYIRNTFFENRNKFVNTRYLSDEAKTYELEKFERNKMLIFNHINFPDRPRRGTEKDVKCLMECFERRAFEIELHNDCTKKEIREIMIKALSEKDLSDYGCFVVVVLTHGSDYGLLLSYDKSYYETDLIDLLDAPSIITKPKMLIIQACRGSEVSQPVQIAPTKGVRYIQRGNIIQKNYTVIRNPDMLILYSTFPGTVAHRDINEGSWFIQCLCKHIEESEADQDIHFIINHVFRDISINYQSQCTGKQMPVFVSTLTRKLQFPQRCQLQNMETQYIADNSKKE